jgi:hypothetical protein
VHGKGVCQQILQHLGGLLDATIFSKICQNIA